MSASQHNLIREALEGLLASRQMERDKLLRNPREHRPQPFTGGAQEAAWLITELKNLNDDEEAIKDLLKKVSIMVNALASKAEQAPGKAELAPL